MTLAQKRTAADPQAGGHPPFEHNAAQLTAPPGVAYYVPMPGMGAPQYQQVPCDLTPSVAPGHLHVKYTYVSHALEVYCTCSRPLTTNDICARRLTMATHRSPPMAFTRRE